VNKHKRVKFFDKCALYYACSVLAGDFNEVYRAEDRHPSKLVSPQALSTFDKFEGLRYVDYHPAGSLHTYVGPRHSARLDTVFTNAAEFHFSPLQIHDPELSDHVPVFVQLHLNNPLPKSPAFWRMKVGMLDYPGLVGAINRAVAPWQHLEGHNLLNSWDDLKDSIKGVAQGFEKWVAKSALDHGWMAEMFQASCSPKPLHWEKCLTGRVSPYYLSTLPSKALSAIAKQNVEANVVMGLRKDCGALVTKHKKIAKEFAQFYQQLFVKRKLFNVNLLAHTSHDNMPSILPTTSRHLHSQLF